MPVHKVNGPTTAPEQRNSLLDQFGQSLSSLISGGTARGNQPRASAKRSADASKVEKKASEKTPPAHPPEKPKGRGKTPPSGNAAAPSLTRMCQPGDAPPEVIHRFEGAKFQKAEFFGGLVKHRDRTHQVVQKQDTNGKWQVSVQPINEGRVNPNQHAFTSNRRVTVADFNDPNSALT